jgi:hypothetical protein
MHVSLASTPLGAPRASRLWNQAGTGHRERGEYTLPLGLGAMACHPGRFFRPQTDLAPRGTLP